MRPTRRLWVGLSGPALEDSERALLEDLQPGGIVLFGRNLRHAQQARRLIEDLRAVLPDDILLAVDQEGGSVERLRSGVTSFPGNMALGAAGFRQPAMGEHLARSAARAVAMELREIGFDLNLAPVLDRASRLPSPALRTRVVGEDAAFVAGMGESLIRGTLEGGLLPVGKHFPGLGGAIEDPHAVMAHVRDDEAGGNLLPFQAAVRAGVPAIMTTHVIAPLLDAADPVTWSRQAVQGSLRGELGFGGVVLSDDLEMGALQTASSFEETVRRTLAAGHDVLLVCSEAALQARAAAVLREGYARGSSWYGDAETIEGRLAALRPPPSAGPPDGATTRGLARAIAGRALTLLEAGAGVLPLNPEAVWCLAHVSGRSPGGGFTDGVRDVAADLMELLRVQGQAASHPASTREDELARAFEGTGPLILALENVATGDAAASWIRGVLARNEASILLLLGAPHDLLLVPEGYSGAVALAYGSERVHLEALAPWLRGEVEPYGRLPLSGLWPPPRGGA